MDNEQTIPFRDCYSKWRKQVFEGLNLMLIFEKIELQWESPEIPTVNTFSQSNYRVPLKNEIESLIKLEKEVEGIWLQENCKVNFLEDYKELECP